MSEKRESSFQSYEDIIEREHPVSRNHPPMARIDRAAQFSPFAALTGYEEALEETGRLTDARRELEEDQLRILDEKLQRIRERIGEHPKAAITYFKPDDKKAGGAYVTVTGSVKKIDMGGMYLILEDGIRIPVGEITELETDLPERVCPKCPVPDP